MWRTREETHMEFATRVASAGGKKALSKLSPWARWRYQHRQSLFAWIILTPILIYYFIFAIAPVIVNMVVSFMRWDGLTAPHWVGLRNYINYFTSPYYLQILGTTAVFTIGGLLVGIPISFFTAVLLNQKIRGRAIHRALWYIPTLTSAAIMAQLATFIVNPYGGILNAFVQSLGLNPVIWTTNAPFMIFFIIFFSL